MARTPTLIKKYSNRRLYDTDDSRYLTLEELAGKVQGGTDIRVIDAKSGEDLTQTTLTQIIIEGRGLAKLLPVPLLTQLIRLGDDALAEFFGRYVTGALEVYLQARRGASAVSSLNPFASLPFTASDALARMWMASPFGGRHENPFNGQQVPVASMHPFGAQPAPSSTPFAPYPAESSETAEANGEPAATADDVAALRREIAALRDSVGTLAEVKATANKPRPTAKKSRSAKSGQAANTGSAKPSRAKSPAVRKKR